MTRSRRARRGFTLPELLVAIGLLAVFAVAATRLFHATIRVGHTTAQQQDAASSFDAAMTVLRNDVWTAAAIAVPDPTTAKLGTVTWTINETTLARDAGDGGRQRTWPAPKGSTFVADGASLVLRVPSTSGERGGDVRMVSEAAILTALTTP